MFDMIVAVLLSSTRPNCFCGSIRGVCDERLLCRQKRGWCECFAPTQWPELAYCVLVWLGRVCTIEWLVVAMVITHDSLSYISHDLATTGEPVKRLSTVAEQLASQARAQGELAKAATAHDKCFP